MLDFFHEMPWFIAAISGISILGQLACLVHIIRTGRPYYWFWVILWFPLLGALAYLFLEVKPKAIKFNDQEIHWRLMGPQKRVAVLKETFEHSPTMKNRYRLADEYAANQQFNDACDLLMQGMQGPFADDFDLLTRIAEAQLNCGRFQEAHTLLAKLVPGKSVDALSRYQLLRARSLTEQGEYDEAEALFKQLMTSNRSEAPSYHYARLQLRMNRKDEAVKTLRAILMRYRRGNSIWRYQEKQWYQAAKACLRAT